MSYMILPLSTKPNQSFETTLSVDDKNLTLSFFVRYNDIEGYWLMDVSRTTTGEALIVCLPLVPGENPAANLLHQYQYLEIGSMFLLKVGATDDEHPKEETLSSDWIIVWGDTR